MKALIGVTASTEQKPGSRHVALSERYIRSVLAGGGLPLILPTGADAEGAGDYLDRIDGLLLTGGGDLAPILYGEDPVAALKSLSRSRDDAELALAKGALARGMPIFGICRGHQVLNVAMGGTLWQDIATQLPEASRHDAQEVAFDEPCHYISIHDRDTRLFEIFGSERVATNSFHHQAVKALAPGLRETASTADGILEAFESEDPSRFVLAVQFHPEGMIARDPGFVRLFEAFVGATRRG